MTNQTRLPRAEILSILRATDSTERQALLRQAYETKVKNVGNKVHFRGIIEFSNRCRKNCDYCGIRAGNASVERYQMTLDEIEASARWAHEAGYGSVVLQSGERNDPEYVNFVDQAIGRIKAIGSGGLGITLSLGEQTPEVYKRWFDSGAHRYLLRIETSNPELYARIHPADHSFHERVACLHSLRSLGFQVGTGVMIGLPGQTIEDLADDVAFFREIDVDMIGMGPYVPHNETPLGAAHPDVPGEGARRFDLAINMIAACRLEFPDINIAATTALQALNPMGREEGLKAGANILMPIITPPGYRERYVLYDGKPCIKDTPEHCKGCLERRVRSIGDEIAYGQWGDAPHALKRKQG